MLTLHTSTTSTRDKYDKNSSVSITDIHEALAINRSVWISNLRCPCENQLHCPRSDQPGEYKEVNYCRNHDNDDPNRDYINDVTNDNWHH